MTAVPVTPVRVARGPQGHYGFRSVARMEWVKLRSVRSTWWVLGIVAAGMIGLAILSLATYSSHYPHTSAADRASFDHTENAFVGLAIGQLVMATLGALAITSEFSSGMIRATLAAVPNRPLVLAAKAAVLGCWASRSAGRRRSAVSCTPATGAAACWWRPSACSCCSSRPG